MASSPDELWRVTEDGGLSVHLHEGQTQAFLSARRITLILAGVQSGKTSVAPIWLYDRIQRFGPGDYLAVAPNFPLMDKKMKPEFLRFFERTLRLGSWRESKRVFEFSDYGARRMFGCVPSTPTTVFFGSAANPDSLESATAKAAWLDEAGQDDFTLKAWESVLGRLSLAAHPYVLPYRARFILDALYRHADAPRTDDPSRHFDRRTRDPIVVPLPPSHYELLSARSIRYVPEPDSSLPHPHFLSHLTVDELIDMLHQLPPPLPGGPILITTTPYNLGWMKQELYDKVKHGQRRDVEVVNFSSLMNPNFPRNEYYERKRTMQPWRHAMRYDGKFTRPAGLIYSSFIDAPAVIDTHTSPSSSPTSPTSPIAGPQRPEESFRYVRAPNAEGHDQPGHKVPWFRIPYGWRRFGGVDFGAVNTCLIWLAEVPPLAWNDSSLSTPMSPHLLPPTEPVDLPRYVVYRCELLGSPSSATSSFHSSPDEASGLPRGGTDCDMETAQFVRRVHRRLQEEGLLPKHVVWCGGAPSERQWRIDYTAAGLPVHEPYISDVEAGIDYVSGAFANNQLYIMEPPPFTPNQSARTPNSRAHDATDFPPEAIFGVDSIGTYGLIEELNTYSRKLDDMMEPTEEIKDKKRFHRLDALRYAVTQTALSPTAQMYDEEEVEGMFAHLNRYSRSSRSRPRIYSNEQARVVHGGDYPPPAGSSRRGVPWSHLMVNR